MELVQRAPQRGHGFNGQGFTFGIGVGTDLQSIAAHEAGHWVGLGHSNVQSATMYFAYSGGTGSRDLHADDEEGVCFLYSRPCSCASDAECETGEVCSAELCVVPPCESDADCTPGLECDVSGDCIVPPANPTLIVRGSRSATPVGCVESTPTALCVRAARPMPTVEVRAKSVSTAETRRTSVRYPATRPPIARETAVASARIWA